VLYRDIDLGALRGPDGIREHDLASLTLLVEPQHSEVHQQRLDDLLNTYPNAFAKKLVHVLWEIVNEGIEVEGQSDAMASYRERQRWKDVNVGTPRKPGTLITLLGELENIGAIAGDEIWERARELRLKLTALSSAPAAWKEPEAWRRLRRATRGPAMSRLAPQARKRLAALAPAQLSALGVKRPSQLVALKVRYLRDRDMQTELLKLVGILFHRDFSAPK
jgi:hypothetical protein